MIQTAIDFPSDLPCAVREGYDLNHVQPFTRTTMVTGRARQRRSFSSVPTVANVNWVFNAAQAAAFEAWFRDVLNDGAEWFNMRLRTPLGMEPYVCRFVEMYKGPELTGARHWKVRSELEVWERPLMPHGWGEMTDFIVGADIIDLAANREWPKR